MCPAKRRLATAALQHVIASLTAGASACVSLRQFCHSSGVTLTVCMSRLQVHEAALHVELPTAQGRACVVPPSCKAGALA